MPVSSQPENPPEPPEPLGDAPSRQADDVVIIGAGPAGLTAAFELGRLGKICTVLEADDEVGGISRTTERDGWRFDIGGTASSPRSRSSRISGTRSCPGRTSCSGPACHASTTRASTTTTRSNRSMRCATWACGVFALRRVLRLGPGPPAQGPGHFRGLGGGEVRVEALPALLQDLHREGVGLPRLTAPSRLGRATHQEPQPLQRREERPVPEERPARDHHPHRPVRVPPPRPGHDVGALPGQGRSGRLEGAHAGRRSTASATRAAVPLP